MKDDYEWLLDISERIYDIQNTLNRKVAKLQADIKNHYLMILHDKNSKENNTDD